MAFTSHFCHHSLTLLIDNAYVSGMSTDLDFHGNQLVQFQTIFVVGNVVGLLPFAYLFPKVPMYWLVPCLDLGWGIFNLLQYRANNYAEIMAYRFMVSIFEVSLVIFFLMNDSELSRLHTSPVSTSYLVLG